MARMRRWLVPLALLAASLACGGTVPETAGESQDLAPPIELVSPGIYRGRRPDQATLQNLKALGVRTILDLEDDSGAVAKERKAVAALGMTFISKPMSGFWPPNDGQVNQTEAVMADASRRPLFVHCLHGEDRTGLIVGLFRVFSQGWKPGDAYKEMIAKGFHRILVFLNHYYEEKTHWDD
jgi:protein tyrosine/serine phosphatase